MKKIIIISAVIISSALTAFCVTSKGDSKTANTLKINKADFAVKSFNAPKSDLASAD